MKTLSTTTKMRGEKFPPSCLHDAKRLRNCSMIRDWLFWRLIKIFYPRDINHMPAVKFVGRLDREQIFLFLDGHYSSHRIYRFDATPNLNENWFQGYPTALDGYSGSDLHLDPLFGQGRNGLARLCLCACVTVFVIPICHDRTEPIEGLYHDKSNDR